MPDAFSSFFSLLFPLSLNEEPLRKMKEKSAMPVMYVSRLTLSLVAGFSAAKATCLSFAWVVPVGPAL